MPVAISFRFSLLCVKGGVRQSSDGGIVLFVIAKYCLQYCGNLNQLNSLLCAKGGVNTVDGGIALPSLCKGRGTALAVEGVTSPILSYVCTTKTDLKRRT